MADQFILAEGAGTYIDVGFIHLSLANALIMGAMVAVFVLALVIPFPHHDDDQDPT